MESPINAIPESSPNEQIASSPDTETILMVAATGQDEASGGAGSNSGPRTERGKRISSQNALKHGLFSKVTVLKAEPRADFNFLLEGLVEALAPQGKLEEVLVERLACILWRLRRLAISDGDLVTQGLTFHQISNFPDYLIRCEASLDKAFDRTLSQLERSKRIRNGHAEPPTLNVNVL